MSFTGSDRSIRGSIGRLISALSVITLVAACDTSSSTVNIVEGGAANMAVEPPTAIFASRMVNRENLILRVIVGSADPIDTGRDPQTGRFQVTTRIPAGQETIIRIEWYESGIAGIEAPGLLLATASEAVLVNAGSPGEIVRFTDESYDTSSPDEDQDGRSNLVERNGNTNPLDARDPPEPVVLVPLNVRFLLPEIFADSDDTIIAQITAIAQINSQAVLLSVEDRVWTGSVDVTENSVTLISVTFRLGSATGLRLASREATEDSGGGTTITFNADTYNLEFNDDGDDFTNAVEIRDGTNPTNSSDPQTDPCAGGQFAEGCDLDDDNDGIPDSVEGPSADEDNDGRRDYTESTFVDADGDGSSAQADAREDDPCIPSEDNQACIDSQPPVNPCEGAQGPFTPGCTTDTDEDGEPDSVEGPTADGDMDGTLDYLDPEDADPCIPTEDNQACIDSQPPIDPCEGAQGPFSPGCTTDTDEDGEPDSVEGPTADGDMDGTLDYLDPEDTDPCVPSPSNQPCQDLQPPDDDPDPCEGARENFTTGCTNDTDGDGEPDSEEGPRTNSDEDNIPDFRDPDNVDSDGDGTFDESDDSNANPCIPTEDNQACIDVQPTPVDDDVVTLPPPPP